jgi:hypothetical protein
MRNLCTIIILFSAVYVSLGQITVTNSTFPVIGDTLRTAAVNILNNTTINVGNAGESQNWDFSAFNTGFRINQTCANPEQDPDASAFPTANLLIYSPGQKQFIRVSDTKVETLGFGGENPILGGEIVVKYNKIPAIRTAPIAYLSTINNTGEFNIDFGTDIIPDTLLASFPIQPDSIRVQFSSVAIGSIDAWGSVTMQGKTFDALREKTEIITDTKLFAKVAFLGWLDISGLLGDNVPGGFGGFLGRDTTTTFNFYTDIKKEILLSADFDTEGQVQNITIADVGGLLSSTKNEIASLPFTVYPNPTTESINIHLGQEQTETLLLTITDITGSVVFVDNIPTKSESVKQCNVSNLSNGQYFLTIRNRSNTKVSSVKFVKI